MSILILAAFGLADLALVDLGLAAPDSFSESPLYAAAAALSLRRAADALFISSLLARAAAMGAASIFALALFARRLARAIASASSAAGGTGGTGFTYCIIFTMSF